MSKVKTPRRPLDYYPTPRAPVLALKKALESVVNFSRVAVLDPTAGSGDLLRHLKPRVAFAIEINPRWEKKLEEVSPGRTVIGDALDLPWPGLTIVSNPPFSLLDPFWETIVEHRKSTKQLCAVFTPVAWWSAEKRIDYIEPDIIVQLGFRPTFHPKDGPAHKGSQDFCWSVLLPKPADRVTWIRAPKPLDA